MSTAPTPRPEPNCSRSAVMISSTSFDLPDHRKAASDAIQRVEFFPLGMEQASARTDSNAIQFSLEMVEKAAIYVGVFGHRYGYVPEDLVANPERRSVTELEYRRAKERGIP